MHKLIWCLNKLAAHSRVVLDITRLIRLRPLSQQQRDATSKNHTPLTKYFWNTKTLEKIHSLKSHEFLPAQFVCENTSSVSVRQLLPRSENMLTTGILTEMARVTPKMLVTTEHLRQASN
ncbi:hypothetical protein F441_10492 [Phytophthora nicotianae CJ01A1]|uniref:Uncharacterized protein n=1 Tax=Phytophthora nicotianae CJ01A1 TaxID=1317063 RepID=W2WYA2_PHYNI|nr:hypothetical protein F441_10492 [Phytophthora nicotianae CJ01A1]